MGRDQDYSPYTVRVDSHRPAAANDDYADGEDPYLADRAAEAFLRFLIALAEADEAQDYARFIDV